jgi:hypothetical protein
LLNLRVDEMKRITTQVWNALKEFAGIVREGLGWVFRDMFGTVVWQSPPWYIAARLAVQRAIGWIKANRRLTASVAAGVVILAGAAGGGWWWYVHLPKPVEVAFNVREPARSRIEEKDWKPEPLTVNFQLSVALLAKAGKDIDSGIEMEPRLEGRWFWEGDKRLVFQPKADWPVGQTFSVLLSRKGLLSENVRLAKYRFEFKSARFQSLITQGEFYQDPIDPKLKKIVATVNFSHPVDGAEFEKRVALKLEGPFITPNTAIPFTVTYDKLKLNAYIHSASIEIPREQSAVDVSVDAGLMAARGGSRTENKQGRKVSVPGVYALHVRNANATLVNNEKLEPEQVLLLETSQTVHEKNFAQNLGVYALPIHHPDTRIDDRKHPYSWGGTAGIGPEILKLSERINLEAVPAEREYTQTHSFKYHADVGRYLYIKVNNDIKSFGGYLMRDPYDRIVRVPEYPKELRILHSGSLLAMSGDKRVSVMARDVSAIRYEIGRVLPQQIQHLVTQSGGNFGKPEFINQFDSSNISERFEEVAELPPIAPGKAQYHGLDLGKYLDRGTDFKRGLFFLSVEGVELDKQKRRKRNIGGKDSRLIVVTDLGILMKRSVDGSQDVFVQSIASGDPVAGASVEVIGKNGVSVLTQTTDAEGHVRFPNLKDFKREQQPVLYVVRKAGDLSFLPMNRYDRDLDFSRFDIGGVSNTVQADKLSAFLFSDRGIYRPGDEIRIGMIVKAADWTKKLAGIPLEAIITDARGLTVKREKLRLSASGFEEIRHTTLETSPTGEYTVNLHVVKDNEPSSLLGSVTVKVREFQPDRLKMSARLSAQSLEGWVSPDDMKARITLQNLFGTPAANRRVTATMTLAPSFPSFPGYRDFVFYDPQRSKEGVTENLRETKTDDKGEAEFDLNLKRFARATYRLLVVAQGFEAEGGRGVTAETGTLVSQMPYLIGYKPDGDLGYVSRSAVRTVEFIGIDPNAKKIAIDGLTLTYIERRYVSVLTKQDNGTYKYESKKKEVKLNEAPFRIAAAGQKYALPSKEPGAYALVVSDAAGQELSRVEYSVAGAANLTRTLEKNAELQLTLNKNDFAPGEEIEVQIKAPYTGAGLITIEREKVHSYRWFKATTTSSVQKIKLPAGLEGNGYVSVTFIRDPGSDEIFMSPLSYGVAPFQVNLDRRKAGITVNAASLVKPGEPLKMKVKADRPVRAVVFVVDEGILQVAGYRTPNPLGFFFQKRALDVKTAQILDLILPEFKRLMAQSAPGGDQAGALGKNLNPFKRKRDKPVAYWSGIVDIGPGEKDLSYVVPDYFNGTLRVMAVAVSEDSIGVSEGKTTVRGDFVLSPNAPVVVAPGDEFDVSVGIANNVAGSGKQASIAASLATSAHFEVLGASKSDIGIGEMQEGVATYRLRAKDKLGSGTLTFAAALGAKTGKRSESISVRPSVPYMTSLIAGDFKDTKIDVPVTRNLYPEFRTLDAGISYVPLTLASGLTAYLGNFSYSCTEQLVSKGMPAIVLGNRPEFGHVKAQQGATMNDLIATLRSRQNAEGGFALWAANFHVNEFASVYATLFLMEARERGYAVPGDMLRSAQTYLEHLAASDGSNIYEERTRAFALYLLTRDGRVTSNYAAAIQSRLEARYPKQWKQDLAAVYLAASYQLMRQTRPADNLISGVKFVGGAELPYAYYYDGLIHNAQLLYITARHFPERMKRLPPEAMPAMVKAIQLGRYNTLSSSYAILAIDAYASAVVLSGDAKYSMAEIARDGLKKELPMSGGIIAKAALSDAAAKVQFGAQGDLTAYYLINQSGFDRALPVTDIKNGFEVLREYTSLDGKPVKSVKLGEELDVHVKMRSLTGKGTIYDVAVVDLLPGGFEVVAEPRARPPAAGPRRNSNVNADGEEGEGEGEGEGDGGAPPAAGYVAPIGSSLSTWRPEYVDIREDRVVLYGSVDETVKEFVYRIKATNTGVFVVPPTFGESMYDRSIQARSLGGKFEVVKP